MTEWQPSELEKTLQNALIAGIQTGVGSAFHPDANALVMIAFRNGADAEKFHLAYIEVRRRLALLEPTP